MRCYSEEHINWMFKCLKGQGKISLSEIEELKPILEELKSIKIKISENKKKIKELKKRISKKTVDSLLVATISSELIQEEEFQKEDLQIKTSLKQERDKLINLFLDNFLNEINRGKLILEYSYIPIGKHIITSGKNLKTKLIGHLIKEDIKRKYKLIPGNRDIIISQLKGLLDNPTQKIIIKADVRSFFESIPFEEVKNKLLRDAYLENNSLRYIKKSFELISQEQPKLTGIPRGLSFSSHLTEIYMQTVDERIREIDGIYYYQRYVDDIIIIASPISTPDNYWDKIEETFNRVGLRLHNDKDEDEDNDKNKILKANVTSSSEVEFDYLGYRFIINQGSLRLRLSSNRKIRYQKKIDCIFNHYRLYPYPYHNKGKNRSKSQVQRNPLKELFSNLSAITGNGHLMGDKSFVSVGVFFSNRHLTDFTDLHELDLLLDRCINEFSPPPNLFNYSKDIHPNLFSELDIIEDREAIIEAIRNVLRKWSFYDGFMKRKFCKNPQFTYSIRRIKHLVEKSNEDSSPI